MGGVYTPPVGWLSRLFSRRYALSDAIGALAEGAVEVRGRVEPLDELVSPLTGLRGVFMRYRASTPSAVRAFGELPGTGLRYAVEAAQGNDFVLRDDSGAALIRLPRGRDISELHADLVDRHGLELEAEDSMIEAGQTVIVRGKVVQLLRDSPHRSEGYRAVLEADSVEPVG
jgi:hypothetical protein